VFKLKELQELIDALRAFPVFKLRSNSAQSQQHAFCIERSHSAAGSVATDGNAVKVENSSTLRTFPSVAARSAAVDDGRERKINCIFVAYTYLVADRAASTESRLAARSAAIRRLARRAALVASK